MLYTFFLIKTTHQSPFHFFFRSKKLKQPSNASRSLCCDCTAANRPHWSAGVHENLINRVCSCPQLKAPLLSNCCSLLFLQKLKTCIWVKFPWCNVYSHFRVKDSLTLLHLMGKYFLTFVLLHYDQRAVMLNVGASPGSLTVNDYVNF